MAKNILSLNESRIKEIIREETAKIINEMSEEYFDSNLRTFETVELRALKKYAKEGNWGHFLDILNIMENYIAGFREIAEGKLNNISEQ